MPRGDTSDYKPLFLHDTPMLDVRAPVEFSRGAFPASINIPILDDSQRESVGTQYKQQGREAAITLGEQLISGDIRENRIRQWQAFVEQHPQGYLYCFRGGLRSRTTQQWLRDQGVEYPLIVGGYKAMRQFLLQQLEVGCQKTPVVVLGGLTGSGKTHVLKVMQYHIDLEGLANHRGSAFGRDVHDYQPTQINFENSIAIELLKHSHLHSGLPLIAEDEGKLIGRAALPGCLHQSLQSAPRIILESTLQERIRMTSDDYFGFAWPEYQAVYGPQAEEKFSEFVLGNLQRIKKRLGGERYKKVQEIYQRALQVIMDSGNCRGFDEGVRILLSEYYDPMYQYQLKNKNAEILFQGDRQAVLEWWHDYLKKQSYTMV